MDSEGRNSNLVDFSHVEIRVKDLIGRLKAVRDENLELKREVGTLSRQLEDSNDKLEELRRELTRARRQSRDLAKEDAIRRKLSALLAKMDALDDE